MKQIAYNIKVGIKNLTRGESIICGVPVTFVRRPATWIPNIINTHKILSKHIEDKPLAKIQNNTHIEVISIGPKQLGRIIQRQLYNDTNKI